MRIVHVAGDMMLEGPESVAIHSPCCCSWRRNDVTAVIRELRS